MPRSTLACARVHAPLDACPCSAACPARRLPVLACMPRQGAGQDLLSASAATDLSGNAKLAEVGPFLREALARHLESVGRPASIKYIDPTYMVRVYVYVYVCRVCTHRRGTARGGVERVGRE